MLLRSLEAGASHEQIAEAHGCSKRTVMRRIAEAREVHGKGWGKPIEPEPPPEPVEVDPEIDGKRIVGAAMSLLDRLLQGRKVNPAQVQGVRIALQFADTLVAASGGPGETEADRGQLMRQIEAVTRPASPSPPPEPSKAPRPSKRSKPSKVDADLAEPDMAAEDTGDDSGAADA